MSILSSVALPSTALSVAASDHIRAAVMQLLIFAAEALAVVGVLALSRREQGSVWSALGGGLLPGQRCGAVANGDSEEQASEKEDASTSWLDELFADEPSDACLFAAPEMRAGRSCNHTGGVTHLGFSMGDKLESWGAANDPDVELARVYGRERRADLAVDLLLDRSSVVGGAPPLSTACATEGAPAAALYGAVLEACALAGDMDSTARAAQAAGWRAPPCAGGQAALLALSRWQAQRRELSLAVQIFEGVRAAGGTADHATYHALLVAAVRSSDMGQAAALFRDMSRSGMEPDLGSYSAMIRGYCAAGDLEQAMMLFHMMRRRGMVPDAALFNAILDSCAWRNMPTLTEEILADMEVVGVLPSNATLSILLRLYGRGRDLPRALQIFEDMPKRHNFELNSSAYGTLISVCLGGGRVDLALENFERMAEANVLPNARTYEAVILGCLRHGNLDRAVELIDNALGLGVARTGPARAYVEPRVVEDVLTLIGRRRQARRLGAPLVRRLQEAGFEFCESMAQSILRSAEPGSELGASKFEKRRSERLAWRALWPNVAATTAAAAF